jgi:hypothetical protein
MVSFSPEERAAIRRFTRRVRAIPEYHAWNTALDHGIMLLPGDPDVPESEGDHEKGNDNGDQPRREPGER